jgi:SAM-dependent methyltransferase
MPSLDPDAIAALHHIQPDSPLVAILSPETIDNFAKTQRPQTLHRINIVKAWGTDLAGKSVLEVGCGQGDASVVLATAVGDGLVTAWDPASPDYGGSIQRES